MENFLLFVFQHRGGEGWLKKMTRDRKGQVEGEEV